MIFEKITFFEFPSNRQTEFLVIQSKAKEFFTFFRRAFLDFTVVINFEIG